MSALILITGFGPFGVDPRHPRIDENPSRAIAFALEREPPRGCRVRAGELPVTFEGAPRAIAELVLRGERPDALLGLGVLSRGGGFRVERRARGRLVGDRPDDARRTASELAIDHGADLETSIDVERLVRALASAGAERASGSDDAGQFVCERAYHELLSRGAELGVPAVFVHVPPIAEVELARQIAAIRALVGELALVLSN